MRLVLVGFACFSFAFMGFVSTSLAAESSAPPSGSEKNSAEDKKDEKIERELATAEVEETAGDKSKKAAGKQFPKKNDDDAVVAVQEVVVTSTRLPTARETSGVSTTVIGGDEIAVHQDSSAAETLRMVPGLTPSASGPHGSLTSLFTRGGNSDHTLIMQDGFKLNAQGGAFNFENHNPLAVQRVEVSRGPGSSLFGTNAMTGTVNYLTRKGEGRPQLTASGAGGTYDTDRETLAIEGEHKKFAYNVSGVRMHRASWKEQNSELEAYNYAGRFDFQINDDHAVKLLVHGSDLKRGWFESTGSGYGTSVEPADPNDRLHNLDWLVGFEYSGKVLPIWETSLRLGYFGSDNRVISDLPNPASNVFGFGTMQGRTFTQERRPSADWQNNILTWESENFRNTVIIGAQAEIEDFNQDDTQYGANMEIQRNNFAGYLQDRLELFKRAYVNLGVRREENGQFGGFTTARADVSVLVPEAWGRFHGSVGNAFRAPSFYELFAPGFGYDGLTPEKNFAFDCGWEQKFWKDRIRLDATYFSNHFKDMVSFDFVSGSFGNLNAAKSSGWELTAEIRPLRRLILRGTGTFLHTQDDAGRRLLRRPPHTYAAQIIAKPINGLDLSFELLSVGDRTDFGPTGRVTNKGYVRADVAASYRFYRHFRAFGRLGNIADVKYEDVKTFPAQGVNFLGGLEFSWRF